MSKKKGDGRGNGKGNGEDGYEVGYKKPPLHSRWKKGESGGGGGHRKKKRVKLSDFEAAFEEALSTLISVNENGSVRQIKKLNALATQTVNKALKGNHQATSLVLAMLSRRAAAGSDEAPLGLTSDEFRAELEAAFQELAAKSPAQLQEAGGEKATKEDGLAGEACTSSGSGPPDDEE